jgi:hypothetical protein
MQMREMLEALRDCECSRIVLSAAALNFVVSGPRASERLGPSLPIAQQIAVGNFPGEL